MAKFLRDLDADRFEEILGRALIDGEFRAALIADPKKVVETLGFKLTDAALQFFQSLNNDKFLQTAEETEARLGDRQAIGSIYI